MRMPCWPRATFKFRLDGDINSKASFALIHISFAPVEGTKERSGCSLSTAMRTVQEPSYDIDEYDYSVLTKRTLKQIAEDAGVGASGKSRPPASTGGFRARTIGSPS